MTTPEDIGALRARILEGAPDPAEDASELGRNSRKALRLSMGEVVREVPEVRVRLHGAGVSGHSVPVHEASKVLDALQGVVTTIGKATRRQARVQADGPASDVAAVTQLSLSADVAPGSVVFLLTGPESHSTEHNDETLLDQALRELFHLLDDAAGDDAQSLGRLTEDLQRLGVRVGQNLNNLITTSLDSDIDLDLGWRTAAGKRRRAALSRRGALALRDALDRSRETTGLTTLVGRLKTVSDGSDKLRLQLDDGSHIRLGVTAEDGATLGGLHLKPVAVTAEVTTTWSLATGQERKQYRFVSAEVIEQAELPLNDEGD